METLPALKRILEDRHEEYCSDVTYYYMAASYEACRYIAKLMHERKTKLILDMGSGISTYTMYLYKMLSADNDIKIWSVETDDRFRKKTINFIKNNLLNFVIEEDKFIMWDEVEILNGVPFDLIFCDIGGTKERRTKFPKVVELDMLGENSAVLFDDCNKVTPMNAWFKKYTFKSKKLQKETMDKIKRWCTLFYDIRKIE